MIDHVILEYNSASITKAYRVYVTDILKAIAESPMVGCSVSMRFAEAIDHSTEDELTGDEIAMDIIERAGLKGKANGRNET